MRKGFQSIIIEHRVRMFTRVRVGQLETPKDPEIVAVKATQSLVDYIATAYNNSALIKSCVDSQCPSDASHHLSVTNLCEINLPVEYFR